MIGGVIAEINTITAATETGEGAAAVQNAAAALENLALRPGGDIERFLGAVRQA